jgi:hypothetical protein
MAIEDIWINPMEFVKIVNDKLEADGLATGSTVFVANVKAFPITEEDPWTQRIKLVVHKMEGDYINTAAGFFLIDPASVEKLSSEENLRLYKVAEERAAAILH